MINLFNLKNIAYQLECDLRKEAQEIHPKLCSRLTHHDIKDTRLNNDTTLLFKFKELKQKEKEHNTTIWNHALTYFIDVLKSMIVHDVDIGYNSDGTELVLYIDDFNYREYVPSIHVQKLYEVLQYYKNFINLKAFWEYDINLYYPDKTRYVNVKPCSTPQLYMTALNEVLQKNEITEMEIFSTSVKAELCSTYKMSTPCYDLCSTSNSTIKQYITSVHEHKVLEELLKHEPGHHYKYDVLYENNDIKIQLIDLGEANC